MHLVKAVCLHVLHGTCTYEALLTTETYLLAPTSYNPRGLVRRTFEGSNLYCAHAPFE